MRGIKITLALSTLLVSSLTSAQGETYSGWDQNLTGEQPAETAANKDEAEYGKVGKAKGEQAGKAAQPSPTASPWDTYSGWDQNLTGEQPAETAANKDEAEYGKAGKAKGEQAGEAAEPCPTTSPGDHRAKKPER